MNILLHKYVSFYVYICVLTYIRFVRFSIIRFNKSSLNCTTNPIKEQHHSHHQPSTHRRAKLIKQQCHSSASVRLRNYSPWMSPSSTRNARVWWNPTPSACLGEISPGTPGRLWCTREAGILHGKRFLWSRLVSSVLWSLKSLISIS